MVVLFNVRHIDFVVASRKFLSCGVRRMTDEKLISWLIVGFHVVLGQFLQHFISVFFFFNDHVSIQKTLDGAHNTE